jgi:chloramphenicol-sensitive protein RarD
VNQTSIPASAATPPPRSGTLYALAAYGLWGLLPLYWKALHGIPLGEVLAHRVLWSLATILVLIFATGRMADFRLALADRRKRYLLGLSSLLIGANWTIYILAVYRGELVQASLGYYINPLMSVGLGVALLGERLNRLQVAAVALAGVGVVFLGLQHKGLPWVALGLAVSFAFYGFVKKKVAVDSLAGLGVETLWLTPIAAGYLAWLSTGDAPAAFIQGAKPAALLIGTGIVTLSPLFFFNGAAKRLPLSTLGFFQYLSPTIQLIMAVVWFHEPFTRWHAMAFGLIWTALALFTWGMRLRA